MRITSGFALREVRKSFEHLKEQMETMHGGFQMRPSDGTVIKHVEGAEGVTVECAPVVCWVPERASHTQPNLYVVFSGRITFSAEQDDRRLLTMSYGTNFGYFATRGDDVTHVLGGHYDFAPSERAHPRAHLQLRSQADMFQNARNSFRSISDLPLGEDLMRSVLSGARPPTAQMDFLSFMLQVCADHLVDDKSSAQVISTFETLSSVCAPVLGYQAGLAEACSCHRAPHWYPQS